MSMKMKKKKNTWGKVQDLVVAAQRTKELTPAMKRAIMYAAQSKRHDMKEQAWVAADHAANSFICSMMAKYGVRKHSSDFDDYRSECCITVMQHLEQWDPRKGDLSTFMGPHLDKTMMRLKKDESGMRSLYYEGVRQNIQTARGILQKRGEASPLPSEIRDVMSQEMGVDCSLTTVRKVIQMSYDRVSLSKELDDGNTMEDVIPSDMSYKGASYYEEEDKKAFIMDVYGKLSPVHQTFIKAVYEVCSAQDGTNHRKVHTRDVFQIVRQTYPNAEEKWLEQQYEESMNVFRHLGKEWASINGYQPRRQATM